MKILDMSLKIYKEAKLLMLRKMAKSRISKATNLVRIKKEVILSLITKIFKFSH